MVGTTISHYKILEKLGEGGMGIVYKAQDTKLNRMVALKFLPDRVRMDEAAKARFLQEAQAAAGLNHNNICTIFGVEDVDGSLFMVMEYVEGGTLRERLPFAKIDEAISIASQIGEALQEAHSKDIVHRDVKAENIMLTAKGQAKVMDFGLAKLKGSLKLTRTSSTVGTMGYMAPEQIQGGDVDDRSDIFSFGVLLFEMLTGKLPFRGEHEAAMVYSIVNEEPQDITQMLPDLSPIVVNCIQRCLEKDPKERYQHFDDIVADLRRSQRKTSRVMRSSAHMTSIPSTQPTSSADIASAPARGTTSVKRRAGVIGGALGGVAAIAFVVWFFSGPSLPRVNPNMEVSVMQIPATEYYYPGISPDGKWLTFPGADLNGKWDIYMMLIETGESKRVTFDSTANLFGASTARFSSDGTQIAYGRLDPNTNLASVCVVSVLSGQVRVAADTGVSPRWSPVDGRIYYVRWGRNRLYPGRSAFREYWSVSPKGGDPRVEFVDSLVTGRSNFFSLGMSPKGRRLVFTRPTGDQINEMFVRDLETGEETQLTHDKKVIDETVWADNGYIFFTSNRSGNFNIWAMPEEGGDAVQVTRGPGPDNGLTYSKAANRMVFSQRTPLSTAWIVNTNGTGNRQLFPEDNVMESHISPDGNRLVLRISHPTLQPTLMLRDISGGGQDILFPPDSAIGRDNAIWSPNGKAIAFMEYRPGSPQARGKVINITGDRRVRDLGLGGVIRWTSDSTMLMFRNAPGDTVSTDYRFVRHYNLNSGVESSHMGSDTLYTPPILGGSKMLIYDQDGIYLHRPEQFRKDPASRGTLLIRFNEIRNSAPTDSYLYYRTRSGDAIWLLDFRTFKRSKVVDLRPSDNVVFEAIDYNDKVLTYAIRKAKTSIVRVDKVFVEN